MQGDFTNVATWAGFVSVAFVIDTFARRIVGWRISRAGHAGFALDTWERALHERQPVKGGGLVPHSDRGVRYVSIRYTERLAEAGVEPSVGSVGDGDDNALAETIDGLHRRGPLRSFEAFEFATLEWAEPPREPRPKSGKGWAAEGDRFNNRRLLETIGKIPPAKAEARDYAQMQKPWPPDPNQMASGKRGAVQFARSGFSRIRSQSFSASRRRRHAKQTFPSLLSMPRFKPRKAAWSSGP